MIVEALTGSGRCVGRPLPRRLVLGADAVPYVFGSDGKADEVDAWADLVITTNHSD